VREIFEFSEVCARWFPDHRQFFAGLFVSAFFGVLHSEDFYSSGDEERMRRRASAWTIIETVSETVSEVADSFATEEQSLAGKGHR